MTEDNNNRSRATKYAWAQYYREVNNNLNTTIELVKLKEVIKQSDIPSHIAKEFIEMAEKLEKRFTCPVCLDLVSEETVAITFCGHIYCKTCLENVKRNTKKCALCRKTIA